MNIRILRVDMSGIESRLDRLNHILETVAIRMGCVIDMPPGMNQAIQDTDYGATYTSAEREIIEEHVTRRGGK